MPFGLRGGSWAARTEAGAHAVFYMCTGLLTKLKSTVVLARARRGSGKPSFSL